MFLLSHISSYSSGHQSVEVRAPTSGSPRVEAVESSSSEGVSSVDLRAFKDLEFIRSFHDCDSMMSAPFLDRLRTKYFILSKYVLQVLDLVSVHLILFLGLFACLVCSRGGPLISFLSGDSIIPSMVEISPSQMTPNSWHYMILFIEECRYADTVLTHTLFAACSDCVRGIVATT